MHPFVFWSSLVIIATLLAFSLIATESADGFFSALQGQIAGTFGGFYILSMSALLLFALFLLCTPFGTIRLGADDTQPEFSLPTWFAMLFSAGMGIGLLFYSVAEPIMHFSSPPSGEGGSAEAARFAMGLTFFHWGLHPWAVYAIVGLCIAYFSFRQGLPLSIRSAFFPLLGERIHGRIGDAIDTLAVVSTLFGVATSLGLGAMQINAGFNHVFGLQQSTTIQVIIIALITLAATASVVSGLDAGVRRLSELNMGLATALLCFVVVLGPTTYLLTSFFDNLGAYLEYLPQGSFALPSFVSPEQQQWLGSWTIFYWAWWIAWAPFVGIFIARVSKGRTIREFLAGVLLAPTLAGFVWLTIFGNTALHQELYGTAGISEAVSESVPTAIFMLLERYPFASLSGLICTLCIVLFFVTSSDSASLVIDTIASGGKENPPVAQRVFWAVLEGLVAGILLLAGGLSALQTAAITTALPFCFILLAMCLALFLGLRQEKQK